MLANIPEDLAFSLTNQSGKDSYPISGVIYAVCYQAQPADEHDRVVDFLRWATHEGQQVARGGSYAPLPAELVERVDQKLNSITVAR
jgi:phosphate transport system substrate-binding protein